MARHARQKDDFGVFHIIQTGGGRRKIFESDKDRLYLLSVLAKAHAKFDFKLYAYCLINDDSYHLVLDVNGGDLSKIMKSINISYAMYAKCEERLFKDRYRSTLLESDLALYDVLSLLRENGQKHDTWNSFCVSQNGSAFAMDPVPVHIPKETLQPPELDDGCQDCIRSVSEAYEKLSSLAQADNTSIEAIIQDKNHRNELIRRFRGHSTLSLKDLGQIFGGLSESSVSKILSQ